jgi:hypothetical protein
MQRDAIAMIQEASPPASVGFPILPVIAALLAIGIFAFDTFTALGMVAAVQTKVWVIQTIALLPPTIRRMDRSATGNLG